MLKKASPKSADKLHRERAYQYKMMMWVYYETDYDNYTEEERLQLWALGCFFEATIGVDWDYNTNWMVISQNTTWCDWHGLTCDERRMVTRLELPQNHVQRNIPAEFKVLPSLHYLGLAENSIGRLDSMLFEMYTLEVIDLDGNGIEMIPEEIPIRNQVKELYLAGNRIREIPESILMLSKLEVLWLWTNLLEDTLPEFMGRMSNLIELDLEDNFLTGDLWPAAEMQSLEHLFVFDNIMGGEITSGFLGGNTTYADGALESSPVLKCMTLKSLDMSTNYWYGTIPTKIANMVNMEELYLEDNQLSGTIAPEIFSLRNLNTLFLGTNYLSSALPLEIGNARSLKSFHAENNYREQDNGRLISKGIYGQLPATMLNLKQLEELVLDNNYVEGTLMPALGSLQHLSRLRLVLNMLQGPIPSSIQNLTKLKDLQLWGNYMTGHLPNNLSLELERLQIHDNSFVGTIPPEWGRCRDLTVLDLSYNDLTGPVPNEFGNLTNLTEFYTEFNVLYGFMPEEVCLLRREGDLDELSANCDVPREDTPPPTLRPTRRPTRRPTLRPTWSEGLVRHHRTLQKENEEPTEPPITLTPNSPETSSPTDSPSLLPSLLDSQGTNAPTDSPSLLPSIQVRIDSTITSNPISGTNSPTDDPPSSQVSIYFCHFI
jgi:Leucine-rich repeat (LRR) protein